MGGAQPTIVAPPHPSMTRESRRPNFRDSLSVQPGRLGPPEAQFVHPVMHSAGKSCAPGVHLAEISTPTILNAIPLSWSYSVGDTGLEPMTSTV